MSYPDTSDDRTFQKGRKHYRRAGRRCVACLPLSMVLGCHGRFVGGAQRGIKSLTICIHAKRQPPAFHTWRLFMCVLPAPQRAHKETGLASPHTETAGSRGASACTDPCAPPQSERMPFGKPSPSTTAKTNQPQAQKQAHRDAARCFRPPARISSFLDTSDYRIHAQGHLSLLSYRLHSSSIHSLCYALNLHGGLQSRSKLLLWLNQPRVRAPGATSQRIWSVAESLQTSLVAACFPVVRRWWHSRSILCGQRSAHSQRHGSSRQPARTNYPTPRCSHMY